VHVSGRDVVELLTAKDLEAWLKIDVKTIYAYVQMGFIPYTRIRGHLRFRKQRIIEWLEKLSYTPR
jgi:excisionase family DNA binding protein